MMGFVETRLIASLQIVKKICCAFCGEYLTLHVEIPVLYEDAFCLIVNKPNNVLVHHSHYARNIEEPSLVELLREQGYETPVPVHRLDHKTSGVLLFAKAQEYVKTFQELFESKAIVKTYKALLRGHVPEQGV